MKKIILILLPILIYSCSSNHEININSDNSATVNFTVTNKDSLVETLMEWGAIENSDASSIINIDEVKNSLKNDKNIKNVTLTSLSQNRYNGSFFVTDIDQLFADKTKNIPKNLQVFSLTEENGSKTLKIRLSLDNYVLLKESLPILQQESIDMLGPDANQDVSEEEYLDMMSFSLGDDGPKDILNSFINLKINVDGSITDIKGGKIDKFNSAIFNVPLIDIILLKKTLIYSLTYK